MRIKQVEYTVVRSGSLEEVINDVNALLSLKATEAEGTWELVGGISEGGRWAQALSRKVWADEN